MKPERQADLLFITGLILLTACHAMTSAIIWMLSVNDASTTAHEIAQAFEANPTAVGLVSSFKGIEVILSYIIMPAVAGSGYWVMRRYRKNKDSMAIYLMATFVFFSGLMNFSNDFGSLIGVMMGKGLI